MIGIAAGAADIVASGTTVGSGRDVDGVIACYIRVNGAVRFAGTACSTMAAAAADVGGQRIPLGVTGLTVRWRAASRWVGTSRCTVGMAAYAAGTIGVAGTGSIKWNSVAIALEAFVVGVALDAFRPVVMGIGSHGFTD